MDTNIKQTQLKKIFHSFLILLVVIIYGTLGYYFLEENFTFFDAIYMTAITISTTGFLEVRELSTLGRIHTIIIIFTGILAIGYIGGRSVQFLIENQIFRSRKMNSKLDKLSNHYIVCGFGRMGRYICEGLKDSKVNFVVIEKDEKKIDDLILNDYTYLVGDATLDEILIKAGIKKAKGLVSVIKSDAENVFTVLSAKQANPNIYIISRAVEENTESKLLRAGANRVVKPYEIGGSRMVQLLLKPGVQDFIDGIIRNKNIEINLEEIKIGQNSILIGKSLRDSQIRKNANVIIVAFVRKNGELIYNPSADEIIEEGYNLIAIGENENLRKLEHICNI